MEDTPFHMLNWQRIIRMFLMSRAGEDVRKLKLAINRWSRCELGDTFFFFFLSLFIYFEREREYERGRGRERERIPSSVSQTVRS